MHWYWNTKWDRVIILVYALKGHSRENLKEFTIIVNIGTDVITYDHKYKL